MALKGLQRNTPFQVDGEISVEFLTFTGGKYDALTQTASFVFSAYTNEAAFDVGYPSRLQVTLNTSDNNPLIPPMSVDLDNLAVDLRTDSLELFKATRVDPQYTIFQDLQANPPQIESLLCWAAPITISIADFLNETFNDVTAL